MASGQSSTLHPPSTIPLWLGGKQVTLSSTFPVISPVDQGTLYECSSATEEDVIHAVESAESALRAWSRTKPAEKRDIFLRAAHEFDERGEELHRMTARESARPDALIAVELKGAGEACRVVAGLIQEALTASMPVPAEEDSYSMVIKEPYGVILTVAPWNAPFFLALRGTLQPLAMGNTVILKGPESTPGVYWAIASILHRAGLPPGVLNTIYHRTSDASKITTALVTHPLVKKINFTGSSRVGAVIASLAGQHLKPTVMELGGKASAIVCEDADIQQAAMQCVLGAFANSGQVCMSTERILVRREIADDLRTAINSSMDYFFGGGIMPTPRLISPLSVERNKALVQDALNKGASILYGDPYREEDSKTEMSPVVLEGVSPAMEIYHQESFGPTASFILVSSDDEAIKIANDTEYGLSSAVFSADLKRAFKIARKLDTGAVNINSMTIHEEPAVPHGGVKKSGYGRFNGLDGLQEWTRTKCIIWKE